jgi:hypothetical protein
MFVAAYFYYKNNKEDVDNQVESGKEEAIRQLSSAGSTIRTKSTQVFYHARRCYPLVESGSSFDTSVVEEEEDCASTSSYIMLSGAILPGIFRDDVRQDWIDATFGKDFYSSHQYSPPRQGIGEAGIPSFVTFSATIPASASQQGDKVGVTLSRIAVGLYVRKVEPGSEAHCAGVQEGSILVDINGMGMLGEPSRQALERLWQYEGFFDDENTSTTDSLSGDSSTANDNTHHGPLALRFYKNGRTSTVLLFSNARYGISWAPCGNFALVQKAYSFAEKAGARRGCLVAAVNGINIRDMDHQVAASEIRDLFVMGKEISLTFCYTPAASRSGFFERARNENLAKNTKSPKVKRTIASADGVEVRVHPHGYGRFWRGGCGTIPIEPLTRKLEGSISELAERVVAGEVEAPTGSKQTKPALMSPSQNRVLKARHFGKCPPLPKELLLTKWDPVDALLYCLQVHEANYDEDQLSTMIGRWNDRPRLEILQRMMQTEEGWKIANAFLLQWVSVLCISEESQGPPSVDNEEAFGPAYIKELSSMLLGMVSFVIDGLM